MSPRLLPLALLLAAASLATSAVAAGSTGGAEPTSDPQDHRASTEGPEGRNEPSVAVDPADGSRVATAANDDGSRTIGIYLSSDGGRSFTVRADPPPLPDTQFGSDPHLAYHRSDLLAAYLNYANDPSVGGLVLGRRSTKTGTWTTSVVRSNERAASGTCRFADFPALAVDRRPGKATVYVAWQELIRSGPDCEDYVRLDLYAARSDDGGRTWSKPTPIPYTPDAGYLPSIAVGTRGEVYVTFNEIVSQEVGGATPCALVSAAVRTLISRSTDGARSFTTHPVQTQCLPDPPLGYLVGHSSMTGATYRLPASTNTVVDPRNGRLVSVVGGADPVTLQQRVYVATSADGGRTWTDRGPLPVTAGENQQLPRLAVGRDGRLSLLWLAQLPGSVLWASHSWSLDGGVTWREPERIASVPARTTHPGSVAFIGDYLGNDVGPDGRAHPVWTDTREYQGVAYANTIYTRRLAP